jgi:cation transport ATPase
MIYPVKNNKITDAQGFKIVTMIFCIAVTALTLNQYAQLIGHLITIKYNWQFELCMVTGMLFFQYPFIYKKTWSLKLDYYFNMLLVSLIGAALLFPLLMLNHYSNYNDTFNIIYFFAVVLIMFFDHKGRVAKLNLPSLISYTWVLYRIIILIFILK